MGSWIAALVALVLVTSPTTHQSATAGVRYLALIGGCVVFIVAWYLVARMRRRPTAGLMGLGLIPILAASALASPIEIAPSTALIVSGTTVAYAKSNPKDVHTLSPELLAALHWLKAHSSVNAVIAVSNHWLDAAGADGRYYYYSAFSERQVFIEGYDASRYEISTNLDTSEGANFERRETLNDDVFQDADAAALQTMTAHYGVRFLLIDSQDADSDDDNPAVLQLGTVVFDNPAATIVAVG
jgi:hypothetical protein